MNRVLVAGLNCRPVSLSAKRLGFEVHVVDFFGDVDLRGGVDGVYSTGGEYSSMRLVAKAIKVAEKIKPDFILLTSELGCNPDYVSQLESCGEVVGNKYEAVSRVRNWNFFFARLDELSIAHPKTFVVSTRSEAEKAFRELGKPVVIKPTHSSAGFGVELVESLRGVFSGLKSHKKILVQEYVPGKDASVSALGAGKKAKAVSFNKQFLGLPLLGCSKRFQYCGNMVPYESRMRKECLKIAEVIGEEFGLSGSYGIDFVLSEKPYVIEVNPRFQDTLECIERVYDTNVVDLHMKACSGMLPEKNLTPKRACSKGILYARKKLVVGGDLTKVSCCVDVYRPGTVVKKDEPVCSAFGCGKTSEESFLSLKNKISEVQGFLKEV